MTTLAETQAAAGEVEQKMISFLLQYSPVNELKVEDIKAIAFFARQAAFDNFQPFTNA